MQAFLVNVSSYLKYVAFLLPFGLLGQAPDSVLTIPMFEKSLTVAPPTFNYVQTLDSLDQRPDLLGADVAQLLARESNIYINDNGPGMLATPSYRGGGAEQTAIVWNGARLNSPMLGSTDLSQLAANQFQSLSVFTSSSTNIYGSGGIGGGIWLGNRPNFKQTFVLGTAGTSSFDTYAQGIQANVATHVLKQPFAFNVNVNHRTSVNDFAYTDNSEEEWTTENRAHASFNNLNIQTSVASEIGKKVQYEIYFWRTHGFREVPNSISLRVPAEAVQHDTSNRVQLLLHAQPSKRWKLDYMGFFERNSNAYTDDRIGLSNLNEYRSFQQTMEVNYHWNKWANPGFILHQNVIQGNSRNYDQANRQLWQSAMLILRGKAWKEAEYQASYKVQQADDMIYFLPNVTLKQNLLASGKLSARVNYSENVRLPTLNEQYWVPGGNPSLQAETGRSLEAGLIGIFARNSFVAKAQLDYFRGRFDNWVRWLPDGPVFSPQNLLSVRQQGAEILLTLTQNVKKWHWSLHAGGTIAEVLNETIEGDYQMIYQPQTQAQANLEVGRKRWSVNYMHRYTGKRFITSDNDRYMPAFQLGRLSTGVRALKRSHWTLEGSAGIDNLWDVNYQVIAWRPMPKRNFFINLSLQWEK